VGTWCRGKNEGIGAKGVPLVPAIVRWERSERGSELGRKKEDGKARKAKEKRMIQIGRKIRRAHDPGREKPSPHTCEQDFASLGENHRFLWIKLRGNTRAGRRQPIGPLEAEGLSQAGPKLSRQFSKRGDAGVGRNKGAAQEGLPQGPYRNEQKKKKSHSFSAGQRIILKKEHQGEKRGGEREVSAGGRN